MVGREAVELVVHAVPRTRLRPSARKPAGHLGRLRRRARVHVRIAPPRLPIKGSACPELIKQKQVGHGPEQADTNTPASSSQYVMYERVHDMATISRMSGSSPLKKRPGAAAWRGGTRCGRHHSVAHARVARHHLQNVRRLHAGYAHQNCARRPDTGTT